MKAALAFLAHFWPNNVENFPNRENTQKYRRVHGRNSRDELEAGTTPEEEDGSEWGENNSEEDDEDDVGGWALAAHGQLLEAILRLASGGRRPSGQEEDQYIGRRTATEEKHR